MTFGIYDTVHRCMIIEASQVEKGIPVVDPTFSRLAFELQAYYQHMRLQSKYFDRLGLKHTEHSYSVYVKFKELLEKYELNSEEYGPRNPYEVLCEKRSVDAATLASDAGCITLPDLLDASRAVAQYNYLKRYKDKLREQFLVCESSFQSVVERYHVPGRFSWNSAVKPLDKGRKAAVSLDYLTEFNGAED